MSDTQQMDPAIEHDPEAAKQQVDRFVETFRNMQGEVAKFMVGHEETIENVLIAIICGGHVLLEGVPGLGKTALVMTISKAVVIGIPPSSIVVNCQQSAARSADLMRLLRPARRTFLDFSATSFTETGVKPFSRSWSSTSFELAACVRPFFCTPATSRAIYP